MCLRNYAVLLGVDRATGVTRVAADAPVPGELASAVPGCRRFIWPTNRCELARGALAAPPRRRRSRRARVGSARVSAVHLANQPLRAARGALAAAPGTRPLPESPRRPCQGCRRFIWPTNRLRADSWRLGGGAAPAPAPGDPLSAVPGCPRFICPTNRCELARGALRRRRMWLATAKRTSPRTRLALPRPRCPRPVVHRHRRDSTKRIVLHEVTKHQRWRPPSPAVAPAPKARAHRRPAPARLRPAASGAPGRGRRSGPPDPRCRRRAGSRRR